jgi:hypothetical protein
MGGPHFLGDALAPGRPLGGHLCLRGRTGLWGRGPLVTARPVSICHGASTRRIRSAAAIPPTCKEDRTGCGKTDSTPLPAALQKVAFVYIRSPPMALGLTPGYRGPYRAGVWPEVLRG